jgi:Caspase domain
MSLVASVTTRGLWEDPAWDGTRPGTLAVVIGVSRYEGFDGGSTSVQSREPWINDMRSLGQLRVSALTAWRAFQWLHKDYRLDDAPLVWARLLLAPQADEAALAPDMVASASAPTLAQCSDAIHAWADRLNALDPAVAERSRALLIFSGHGVEVDMDSQVLLPSDYLLGPAPHPDHALGVARLIKGLAALPVGEVVFLMDACRSDTAALRDIDDLTGARMLTAYKAVRSNPKQKRAVLHATASGRSAFQHDDPAKGLSMFGTALLEAVKGREETVAPLGQKAIVPLRMVPSYMKLRVFEMLKALPGGAAAADEQQVQLTSRNAEDLILTELVPPPVFPMSGPQTGGVRGLDRYSDAMLTERRGDERGPGTPLGDLKKDWGRAHDWFGSEDITDLWLDHTWVKPKGATQGLPGFSVLGVERSGGRHVQRILLRLNPGECMSDTVWLEQRGWGGDTWGCLLPCAPGAQADQLVYRIDARYSWDQSPASHGRARMVSMTATVVSMTATVVPGVGPATAEGDALGLLAQAWVLARGGELAKAQARVQGFLRGREGVNQHPEAPTVGDLLAGASLLTTGTLDRHLAWLLPRAEQTQVSWPDFRVMLADAAFHGDPVGDGFMQEALRLLCLLQPDDVPVTAIAFSRGHSLLRQILENDEATSLAASQRQMLVDIYRHWHALRRYLKPSGLFVTFGGYESSGG